jgi:hypothetical protein
VTLEEFEGSPRYQRIGHIKKLITEDIVARICGTAPEGVAARAALRAGAAAIGE